MTGWIRGAERVRNKLTQNFSCKNAIIAISRKAWNSLSTITTKLKPFSRTRRTLYMLSAAVIYWRQGGTRTMFIPTIFHWLHQLTVCTPFQIQNCLALEVWSIWGKLSSFSANPMNHAVNLFHQFTKSSSARIKKWFGHHPALRER